VHAVGTQRPPQFEATSCAVSMATSAAFDLMCAFQPPPPFFLSQWGSPPPSDDLSSTAPSTPSPAALFAPEPPPEARDLPQLPFDEHDAADDAQQQQQYFPWMKSYTG
jgi:hypothetical protein